MFNRLISDAPLDLLADVLETLRFRCTIFFRSDLASPWGISMPHDQSARFHIILSGHCVVGTEDNTVDAREMDIVMLPKGTPHWIADKPGRRLIPIERAINSCELDNPLFRRGKVSSRLMCGIARFQQPLSHPFIEALPQILHFRVRNPGEPIWSLVRMIDDEMQVNDGRSSLIGDRLTEALFLHLLYDHVRKSSAATGFLAALRDKRVLRALSLMHREPDFEWTLTSLGQRVGMSRATLVRQFQSTVGMAPMAYLAQ